MENHINFDEKLQDLNRILPAASDIYEKVVYKSRVIKKCSSYWLNHGTLPKSLQGCHQKTKSFIDDEDVIEQSLNFVRTNDNKVTPCKYKDFVNK
ncbi:11456_t:CDS:2, partial [Entrophospora sp. SA101]